MTADRIASYPLRMVRMTNPGRTVPRIRVAASAIATTPLARRENLDACLEAVARARADSVSLLCLPELALTGYGCEDAFHAPFVLDGARESLLELAEATAGMVVCVGLPLAHHRALYDVAAVLVDTRIVGFVAKKHLAGDGVHYEPRWFKPWPAGVVAEVELGGARIPIGDLVFEIGGIRLGFEICEDAWVADRPGISLAARAVDVVLNPSASHFAFGKSAVRERFVAEGSRAFAAGYVYANLVGNEAGRVVYDGETLVAASGTILARGPRLSYARVVLTPATLEIARIRTEAMRTVSYSADPRERESVVALDFPWPEAAPALEPVAPFPAAFGKEDELARAVALGLYGYLRKSRSNGFVLGLSGGVDSAAVACLVRLMIRFSVAELGLARVRAELGYAPGVADAQDEAGLMRVLLTTLYQAAGGSTESSRLAARGLAESLGGVHHEVDLRDTVADYVGLVEGAIGRSLAWSTDDLALQNVQARVRAPSVWLVANVEGKLLLTTSNRSEAALGYATMDGDTAGGLAPIAGIDKAYLRRWLEWLESIGAEGHGPIPALAAVNARPSTPELRPVDEAQTSEEDLMPFRVLDRIERHVVRDRRSPRETAALLVGEFPELDASKARDHVVRFVTLFARNQWKRERYAPSFHLDDENLDPKTWFRFPILSAGWLGASSDAGFDD